MTAAPEAGCGGGVGDWEGQWHGADGRPAALGMRAGSLRQTGGWQSILGIGVSMYGENRENERRVEREREEKRKKLCRSNYNIMVYLNIIK